MALRKLSTLRSRPAALRAHVKPVAPKWPGFAPVLGNSPNALVQAAKNSEKKPLGALGGEKSARAAARSAGGGGRAGLSAGTRSRNMDHECTPIQVVHKGRPDYVET